jgi:murein DD-endopeptidase MepM/ murein hydrolase activator NlpD
VITAPPPTPAGPPPPAGPGPELASEIDAAPPPGDDPDVPWPGYTGGGEVRGDNPVRETAPGTWDRPVVLRGEAFLDAPRASVERAEAAALAASGAAAEAAARAAAGDARVDELGTAVGEAAAQAARAEGDLARHRRALAGAALAWYVKGSEPVDLAGELLEPGTRAARARLEAATGAAMDVVAGAVEGAAAEAGAARERADALAAERRAAADAAGSARAHAAATALAAGEAEAALAARRAELTAAQALTHPVVDDLGADAATFPVAGPWEFRDSWGDPRSGGRRHRGSDVWAPEGTPLVAIEDGVARADADPLGGLTVWLDGASGATYYYAHLEAVADVVRAAGALGRRVEAGEVVGFVGDTGNAAGGPAHLHIQIAPAGGDWQNPYPALASLSAAVTEALGARPPAP